MRARGALRLSDVLEEESGLSLLHDHGTGLQVQGFDPDYTLILIDGEPVVGRTAGTLDLDRLTVSGLERVEIVRGPSSSLYGSEALAGVVNLITQRPNEGVRGSVGGRYGTHGTSALNATLEAGTGRLAGRLLVDRYASQGYDLSPSVLGATTPQSADYTADGRLRLTVSSRARLQIGVRYNRQRQENAFALKETAEAPEVPHDQRDTRTDWSLHPALTYRFSEYVRTTASLYLARFHTTARMTRREDGALYYADEFDQRYGKAEVQVEAGLERLGREGQLAETLIQPGSIETIRAEHSVAYNVGFSAEPLGWLDCVGGPSRITFHESRTTLQTSRLTNRTDIMHPGFDADAPYLFQTDHGCVLHCTCCHRFEVSFKQTQLRMEREAFAQIVDEIGRLPLERWEPGSYGVLRLTPPEAPSEVRLLLMRSELQELRELLHGAAVMSELDDLIESVLQPSE